MTDYNQNPFGSTHSLDHNPFDDPQQPSQQQQAGYDQRIAAVQQREADLERRESELNQRAEHIRTHGKNNWPPFFPLIFHSIKDEIPENSRPLMTRMYQLWLVLLATLIINFVACLFVLLGGSPDGGHDLGASIGYMLFISVCSFLLWYRPIYNGYMKEQALYYYLYFFFCGFHLLFSFYMIIGIPSTGSAGLIQTVGMFNRGAIPAGILCIIATVGWTIQGVGHAWYYKQIWAHHTAAGHSFDKAKTELATQGAKSYFTRG
ncbi:scamp family-domain-containing protein [Pterulicium gracile]|uniref:Scamp family-domain-containing protein n=1 Tax=Pterulicium gracile TaxID=1884261 RepID=A0A5C3R1G3_9AGAR|nr:scamp family-domain-containing protein [Pterula gracilis]